MTEATYTPDDLEHVIDHGTHIPCPDCGTLVTLDRMLRKGCWEDDCRDEPWSFTVEVDTES